MHCEEVLREISNFMDGEVASALRKRMEHHLDRCLHCKAVLDGIRNAVLLAGDERAFELPDGFSERLHARLSGAPAEGLAGSGMTDHIPLGVTEDSVPPGSHLIYFWESDAEFERGVRFLDPGLETGDDHCIVFGHDEAIDKVLRLLRAKGFDPDRLVGEGDVTVLRRRVSAKETLSDIGSVVQAAVLAGARAVRFLGNLGMGRDPLPAGEDDVITLESEVSSLISTFPCVVLCMYDVRTLPGRLILRGGLETHRLVLCTEGLRENPHYVPQQGHLRHIH
ncbi:MAG: MEDS domain-containing protein [Terriglobales bacterium]